MGNVLSETVGDWSASFAYDGTTPRMAMATEQTTSFPVEHDAAGNEGMTHYVPHPGPDGGLVSDSNVTVTRWYSPRNLLERVEKTTYLPCGFPCRPPFPRVVAMFQYAYDGRGVRVHLDSEQAATDYVYTPELNLSLIRSGSGDTTEIAWFNGHPAAQITTGASSIYYTFTDHLGTPLIQTDPSTAIVWRAELRAASSVRSGAQPWSAVVACFGMTRLPLIGTALHGHP